MKSVYLWVSLVTGVLPGIAVILNGFGTPNELRNPFGILAAVCGIVAFGITAFITASVKRRNTKLLAGIVIACGFIGLLSLCSYWSILDQCVFSSSKRSSVFFPLWLSGQAKEAVDNAGGRKAFYEKYGAGTVVTLMESQSFELTWTKRFLLALLLTASIALPVATGVASTLHAKPLAPDSGSRPKSQAPRGSK